MNSVLKPSLLVLAAGIGSRYGGLKQIDPVGPHGEIVVDYSIFDALRAGFGRVVFVIRRAIEQPFRESVGKRLERRMDVAYVFQELDRAPPGRTKPWGTGHAILTGHAAIHEPFGVINADDFYGPASYRQLVDFLRTAQAGDCSDYAMVGFALRQTLSDFGHVARGICECDADGWLVGVREMAKIERQGAGAKGVTSDGTAVDLTGDEIASMNLWGFTPSIFDHLRERFDHFLKQRGADAKAEFQIPLAVDALIAEGKARVKVLRSSESWFGVTYKEDKPRVVENIRRLIREGAYPEKLWP